MTCVISVIVKSFFVLYLKFKFTWVFCILSNKSFWSRKKPPSYVCYDITYCFLNTKIKIMSRTNMKRFLVVVKCRREGHRCAAAGSEGSAMAIGGHLPDGQGMMFENKRQWKWKAGKANWNKKIKPQWRHLRGRQSVTMRTGISGCFWLIWLYHEWTAAL